MKELTLRAYQSTAMVKNDHIREALTSVIKLATGSGKIPMPTGDGMTQEPTKQSTEKPYTVLADDAFRITVGKNSVYLCKNGDICSTDPEATAFLTKEYGEPQKYDHKGYPVWTERKKQK